MTLVVADDLPAESRDGVDIVSVGKPTGRKDRMLNATRRVLQQALELDADVYHLHDPELLPTVVKLGRHGKRVIFDAHEDLPRSILSKHWIPTGLRPAVSGIVAVLESVLLRRCTSIVSATPSVARRFPVDRSVVIQNFPFVGELLVEDGLPYRDRPALIVYVGGITPARGAREMAEAIAMLPNSLGAELALAGPMRNGLEQELCKLAPAERLRLMGQVPRSGVAELLGSARIGLVLFHPEPNHIEAQPNKLFEYMSAGIPVIVSDFPLWREIVGSVGCGLLVDPLDPQAIADAIRYLLDNPEEAESMGRRGLEAVRERFNWDAEARKLIALYERITA